MVHDTPARRKARELKAEARGLEQKSTILEEFAREKSWKQSTPKGPKKLKNAAKYLNQFN